MPHSLIMMAPTSVKMASISVKMAPGTLGAVSSLPAIFIGCGMALIKPKTATRILLQVAVFLWVDQIGLEPMTSRL